MSPRGIVITGASAGIGQALARHYAKPGLALALVGRNEEALAATAASCRAAGAEIETIRLDVRDSERLAERLLAFDSAYPVDQVIANAGAALPEDNTAAMREVFDVNLLGALNTCLPLLPAMQARGRGQIALMSSLAALSPLPDAAAYSGAKAALFAYGLALRQKLQPAGIGVSVICPGFIATGMGDRYQGWRPLEMSADAAAARIAAGLARDRAVIAFPWPLYAAARLGTLVPEPVLRLAMKAFSFSIDKQG
jgi:short-subunit dehydrogenase